MVEVDHAVLEALEGDVAAIAGHGRAHAALQQLLDGGDGAGVALLEELLALLVAAEATASLLQQRLAGEEVLHDGAEDGGLEVLPLAFALGHGDEVAAEEHAGDVADREQPARQRANARAARGSLMSSVPSFMTARPGRNFRVAGFGVASVWMNIGLSSRVRFKAGRMVWIVEQPSCTDVAGARSVHPRKTSQRLARPPAGAGARSLLSIMWRGGPGPNPARRPSGAAFVRPQDCHPASASISASCRWPGTMAMGIGKLPAALPARCVTRGPGPSVLALAARTRSEMSSSSSISARICSALTPVRTSRIGSMPATAARRGRRPARGAAGRFRLRLGLDERLDAEPLLELGRADHGEQDDVRARRAPRAGPRNRRPGCIPASRRPRR